MTLKRVPSFSARPDFPKGLQVLVVDSDGQAGKEIASQLKELGYIGTVCSSCGEAVDCLEKSGTSYDVVVAEAKMLRVEDDAQLLRNHLRTLPLVLMSDDTDEHQVLSGIKLGACDFLDKPLSSLKLKNIWQHVVRKMMERDDSAEEDDDECLALDQACFDAAVTSGTVVRNKSEVSLPCPKTPSPAGSTGDLFSMVASHGKQLSDTGGESATSEATREESSARVLRSARRRSTGSHPSAPAPGMVMIPHHGMVIPPPPTAMHYYAAPLSSSMPCMGFMPTPMVMPASCAAQASAAPVAPPAAALPEGLFAADATCAPPQEPDLTSVTATTPVPLGLSLRKSPSLLALLNEAAQ